MPAKNLNSINILNSLKGRELNSKQISVITGIGFATVEKELPALKGKGKIVSKMKKVGKKEILTYALEV